MVDSRSLATFLCKDMKYLCMTLMNNVSKHYRKKAASNWKVA